VEGRWQNFLEWEGGEEDPALRILENEGTVSSSGISNMAVLLSPNIALQS
jgi:hypothetical protein